MAADNWPTERYWILTDSLPIGPLTGEQVLQKRRSGEINWQTLTCRLGDNTWQRLVATPGIGPLFSPIVVDPGASDLDRPQSPNPPLPPSVNWATILRCVVVAVLGGWFTFACIRPLTPREVCSQFCAATTAEAAKAFCTSNLHAAVIALFRHKRPLYSGDFIEIVHEAAAPPDVGGIFVGVRMRTFIPAARKDILIDGIFLVINSNGWKVQELNIFSAEREPLEPPISLATGYASLFDPPGIPDQAPAERRIDQGVRPQPQATKKHDPVVRPFFVKGENFVKGAKNPASASSNSGFGKWVGGCFLAGAALISGLWKSIWQKRTND